MKKYKMNLPNVLIVIFIALRLEDYNDQKIVLLGHQNLKEIKFRKN